MTEVFECSARVLIGGKLYLVERHFTGKRDLRQAVYSAVTHEAERKGEGYEPKTFR